ncbi:hypothetical protein [Catellatospora paridis]|uniref:hypothetical protein n=1 Tax=Catellatospora paridis TaxID=1617086 RepID=UPI0012D4829E|nr:hypothetical protein [Catellatospora paridis]
MTGDLTLDVSILVAAQLLILLIPVLTPHVVYVGHIDPGRYGEQAATVYRARILLALPATVALCWFGATRWLDTGHDVVIVVYIALICRLVMAAARAARATWRGLSWIFTGLVGPLASCAAALSVAERVAYVDPSAAAWIFGGLLALVGPPALVLLAGRFAGQGPTIVD